MTNVELNEAREYAVSGECGSAPAEATMVALLAHIDALTAEVHGLRSGLRRIADIDCYCYTGYSSPCGCGRKAGAIAEDTLEGWS